MRTVRTINAWSYRVHPAVASDPNSLFIAPECLPKVFHGTVENHQTCGTGELYTSIPVAFDPTTRTFETQSGSLYRLGSINPEYAAAHPDAEARILASAASLAPLTIDATPEAVAA